jgi:hypothetical protein
VVALTAAAFLLVAGCASLQPPVDFDTTAPETDAPIRLEVVEGRPNGLLLKLHMTAQVPEAASLQLLRAEAGADADVYREVVLDEPLRGALRTDGVEFFDRNVARGLVTRYQLRLVDQEERVLAYSRLVRVAWHPPPARPRDLTGRATTPETVELRWESPPGHGAIVFRRNVLVEGSTPQRIAAVGPDSAGLFVDTDVAPGVVYAYRISLALHSGSVVQLGSPSEPIYVDVPKD